MPNHEQDQTDAAFQEIVSDFPADFLEQAGLAAPANSGLESRLIGAGLRLFSYAMYGVGATAYAIDKWRERK